jgi:hypothetical protein
VTGSQHRQDIPAMLVPVEDEGADRRVSLMVQDMAAFGPASGETHSPRREEPTRLDYFAH